MITCSTIGCACQGTGEGHRPLKAWRFGYRYFAASFGPRAGDPIGTFVSLIVGRAEDAAENAAFFERRELRMECECGDFDCDLCHPDQCVWGESTYSAADLFSPEELREHRRALLRGEVVCLSR